MTTTNSIAFYRCPRCHWISDNIKAGMYHGYVCPVCIKRKGKPEVLCNIITMSMAGRVAVK